MGLSLPGRECRLRRGACRAPEGRVRLGEGDQGGAAGRWEKAPRRHLTERASEGSVVARVSEVSKVVAVCGP